MSMVRYLIRISYIGTKYRGSQKCILFPNETIQGVIETALQSLDSKDVPITSFASRTDKGVHALMNTFHVNLEHKIPGEVYQPHFIKKKLNLYLKENDHEILVTNASVVPDIFHARKHAKWRSYIYRLAVLKPELRVNDYGKAACDEYLPVAEINRCHIVPSNFNVDIVKCLTDIYCGAHDFSTFTKYLQREPWKSPKRIIEEFRFYESPYQKFMEDPQYANISMMEFYVKSRSFLYHQVLKIRLGKWLVQHCQLAWDKLH